MRATISLLGLYNYDNSILDGLILPSNFAATDNDILKENLLMETAELEILYNDPVYLKYAITQWCKKNSPSWKWLLDTQKYDYNPIWNADYKISDRTDQTVGNVGTSSNTENYTRDLIEEENGQRDYTRSLNESEDVAKTYSGSETELHDGNTTTETKDHITDRTGSENTEHMVSAYNEATAYKPESKDIHTLSNLKDTENGKVIFNDDLEIRHTTSWTENTDRDVSLTGGDTTEDQSRNEKTGGDTTVNNGRTTSDTDSNTKYERWLRGNYGQTTTQQMINEEQELAKFNMLDYIINDFKKRFCLMVY